jgi:hypothetical protein
MVIDLPRILVVALLAFTFLKHLLRMHACCMIFVMLEMCAN